MNACNTVKELATHGEKQYMTTTAVFATTHMEIHPLRGKTGTS